MSLPEQSLPEHEDDRLVPSLVLMSAFSAAADLLRTMSDRRSGQDPTTLQDPIVARRFLRAAADELDDLLAALRAIRAVHGDPAARRRIRFARGVSEVLLLNRTVRLLHGVHQRLLSLYPAVPEELVEAARALERAFEHERDRDGLSAASTLLVETEVFNVSLRGLVEDTAAPCGDLDDTASPSQGGG